MESEVEFSWEGRILSVKNLAYHVKPTDLRDYFASSGKILRVDIERAKDGNSNGLAFIEFASAADCNSAARLHGTQFEGRTMKCDVATKPPPELIRFYIRPVNDRPISDRVRKRIIDEAKGISHENRRRRRYRKNREDIGSDGNEYSYEYFD